jgi:hypothetical protein
MLRGQILGRNWDKSLNSFPPCYLQSPLLTDFNPLFLSKKSGLKLICAVNIVHGNLKSENSQDYALKPQRNFLFMNSALLKLDDIFSEKKSFKRFKKLRSRPIVYRSCTVCKNRTWCCKILKPRRKRGFHCANIALYTSLQ